MECRIKHRHLGDILEYLHTCPYALKRRRIVKRSQRGKFFYAFKHLLVYEGALVELFAAMHYTMADTAYFVYISYYACFRVHQYVAYQTDSLMMISTNYILLDLAFSVAFMRKSSRLLAYTLYNALTQISLLFHVVEFVFRRRRSAIYNKCQHLFLLFPFNLQTFKPFKPFTTLAPLLPSQRPYQPHPPNYIPGKDRCMVCLCPV